MAEIPGFEKVDKPFTVEGPHIKGISAALSISKDIHIIITAKDWDILKKAWKEITEIPINKEKCPEIIQTVISRNPFSEMEKVVEPPKFVRPVRPTRSVKQTIDWTVCWFYYQMFCYMGYKHEMKYKDAECLGIAEVKNKTECKVLLRKVKKFTRSEIERCVINDDLSFEDIPF